MSGPKDYTPPPRYSMKVFDGKLNQVFQLQSRLKFFCSEIDGLCLNDTKLNIQFDCQYDLNKIRNQIEKMLKPLVFDYKGTFGQDTYNCINGEIDSRISELLKMKNACERIKADFNKKKTDYNAFLSYLIFYENSGVSFDEFKMQIIQYLKSNIESSLPEISQEAVTKISAVEFTKPNSKFDFGFNSKIDSEKQLVVDHIIEKEKIVNSIRVEISNKIIDRFQSIGGKLNLSKKINKESEESNNIIEKIKSLIRICDDSAIRKKYKAEFDKLTQSESLKDIYFFKELHDSIFETEKTRKLKIIINDILAELNNASFHLSVQEEQQKLVKSCLNLLNNFSISRNEFNEIHTKLEQLKNKSNQSWVEDEIKKKEHLFLKSQLILCLENQGYEVMTDMEVIDFENETDFYLKIKGQDNFLNLKFKDDGSMRYVFQIPESIEELSTDQKNLKLHEMQVTCTEFKSILEDLSKMGLKINMRSEKPIELNSIISVPKNQRENLKPKHKSQQQQQFRKKYLN